MTPLWRKWKDRVLCRLGLAFLPVLVLALTPGPGFCLPRAMRPSTDFFIRTTHTENRSIDSDRILFEQNCTLCHTRELVLNKTADWERDEIRSALDYLNRLNPAMPDYKGTPAEKDRIADYIFLLNNDGRQPPKP
ncbi:MAG: cytochrome c [Syntrophotaleaceae bacterium]